MRRENISKGGFRFAPSLYLEEALTDRVDDRQVYMKGIDASYRYEGYSTYSMEGLSENYPSQLSV